MATRARQPHRSAYHRHSARRRRHRMEFRQETGAGDVSVPNIVTRLLPWGQTGAIRSRLALFARPAPPAHGLDRMLPARPGLTMLVRLGVTRFAAANSREGVIRRSQAFLRRKSIIGISGFRCGSPCCFHPMDPDEGARHGRGRGAAGTSSGQADRTSLSLGPTVAFDPPSRRSSKGPIVRSHG